MRYGAEGNLGQQVKIYTSYPIVFVVYVMETQTYHFIQFVQLLEKSPSSLKTLFCHIDSKQLFTIKSLYLKMIVQPTYLVGGQ